MAYSTGYLRIVVYFVFWGKERGTSKEGGLLKMKI
jgi:hypothetical protein